MVPRNSLVRRGGLLTCRPEPNEGANAWVLMRGHYRGAEVTDGRPLKVIGASRVTSSLSRALTDI